MRSENQLAWVGGTSAVLAVVLLVVGSRQVLRQQFPVRPDLSKTPGLSSSLSVEEVCASSSLPEIPAPSRKFVFDLYGIDRPGKNDYQIDLLIPAGLGGTNDLKNLWPQPAVRLEWNAHIKDALEEYLRQRVCGHSLGLQEAQHAISTDWIAAYQQYFHSEHPLAIHQHP